MVKTIQSVESLIDEQRQYFYTGQTKQISFRKQQLIALKNAVLKYEKEISSRISYLHDPRLLRCMRQGRS